MDEKNLDVNESTEEEINLALEQALVRCKELEDAHARAIADYRNLERRTEEGRLELRRLTTASVIINLLPIYDDLTRAFEAIDPDIQKHDWVSGISLIHEKFRGVITSTGAIEIDALNQPFNPKFHEAIGYAEGKEGSVVQVMQSGWIIDDNVIRPSMVMVGNGNNE
ncbi:MAG: nucleotide exchange factor GrpE [Chloroflexi bacterium]|nr:nucleotide exchange factor GrpE [Chloroflexota bacterium]|tara:strand:+ start:15294 stop:15794 length:501 start_codon:yes stop_codon:yes gene_type:complete